MSEAKIVIDDGLEYVESDDYRYGLGLQLPATRTASFPTLATLTPLLSLDEIQGMVESESFEFGRQYFSESWITNQNGYGSCAAYGGSSALAKARVLGGQERQDLSGDYLYSLVNGGRDRGSMLDENMRAILTKGVCLRETVPLGGIYRSKYNTEKADAEARRFRGHELYAVPDEQSVATALALRIPVVHAIHVGRNWRNEDSRDVLIGDDGPGNHCEHLDDIRYSREHGRFEFRDASSHNRPYFWIHWGHLKTPSRYHQFYAVPSAKQDPLGDNPRSDREVAPEPSVRLVMESSSGCVWCKRWKESEFPQVQDAGIEVVNGSVEGNGVPKFRLEVGRQKTTHVGFWRYSDIELEIARMMP